MVPAKESWGSCNFHPLAGLSWNERPGRTGRVLRQLDSLIAAGKLELTKAQMDQLNQAGA